MGGSPYFPGSRRGENKEGCGGHGDLRRFRGQGCSKGHQDRELGDPEKVVEAEESESLAGAMGKKPRRITGRSWVGAGQAGRLKEGTRPQGDHCLPSLPEASHPSTLRHTDTPRHTCTHPHTPSAPSTHTTPFQSCGPSVLPTLRSSLSTARSQAQVQSLAPLFRETPPRGDTSMSPERSRAQERGQGTLTSLWKTKVTYPAK